MNPEYRDILGSLLRRAVPASLALALGTGILLGTGNVLMMLVGFFFFLVAAIFLAGPIARWLAEPLGGLLGPKRYYDTPQPMYGIPQSRRIRGRPEEALAEYEKIAAAHPAEVRPWLDMIEIALTDLHDPERANAFYQRGLAALTRPDDRDHLARVYAATRDRTPPRPGRTLKYPPPE